MSAIDRIVEIAEFGNIEKSVREGKLYYHADYVSLNNASYVLHIKTGTKPVSLYAAVNAGAAATISLKEGAACSNNGTAIALKNHNRNKTDDNLLVKLFHTPTITTPGTEIKKNQAGFGTSPGLAKSGLDGVAIPYYLKPSTSYTYTFTMAGNSVVVFTIEAREP